jgi:glycosyltransferase involved in cell wall biosynthesis
MKVLLINNCHYRRGGAETVYFGTAELLLKAGHKVVFFSFADSDNISTGNPEYFVKKVTHLKGVVSYFSNNRASTLLEEVIKKEQPDIAHAHLIWGGMTASIIPILHKSGIPIIHSVHDYRMICPAYTFRNWDGRVCEKCRSGNYLNCFTSRCSKGSYIQSLIMALEMIYRNKKWHPAEVLDGIIYVSEFAKKKHEEVNQRFAQVPNVVLYNFTAVGETHPMEVVAGDYFLYYGRLSREKGISTLASVFANHPELHLKVVGTGPIETELRSKYCNNVEFLGYKSGEELYNLVRKARYVCVPSEWYENNPMTIVEAYSMGVPVIGARIGGIPEIVKDGETGFLFECGRKDSLDHVLKRVAAESDDSVVEHKKAASTFAKKHFSIEDYSQKLLSFYSQVISNFNNNG